MTLAEKIMSLRKKNGWSQEELAEKLNVSRQSVSKWESGVSIPDISKILLMGEIFSVTTDYLLKDSAEDENYRPRLPANTDDSEQFDSIETDGVPVSLQMAGEYLERVKNASSYIAFGASLCICSPIAILLLAAAQEEKLLSISENLAVVLGLSAFFLQITIAAFIFITKGFSLHRYEFMEKENLALQYGIESMVMRRKEAFEPAFKMSIAVGVVMILLAFIPFLAITIMSQTEFASALSLCFLLLVISCAVFMFVKSGMINSGFDKLLQLGDYSRDNKAKSKKLEGFVGAYWCIVTAVFLAVSFIGNNWDRSWIIWPVAAVAFAAIYTFLHRYIKKD